MFAKFNHSNVDALDLGRLKHCLKVLWWPFMCLGFTRKFSRFIKVQK